MKDFRNELLNRREVQIVLISPFNPGFDKCIKLIAEQFKTSEESVVVKKIDGRFGIGEFLIDAFIYNSVQDKEGVEPKPKIKKGLGTAEVSVAAGRLGGAK